MNDEEKERKFIHYVIFSQDITDIPFHVDQKDTPVGNIFWSSDRNSFLSVMMVSYRREKWGED